MNSLCLGATVIEDFVAYSLSRSTPKTHFIKIDWLYIQMDQYIILITLKKRYLFFFLLITSMEH
jgi:hypothetical protein